MNTTLTCALHVWSPVIGDNHPMGWLTVAIYAAAALGSALAARRLTDLQDPDRRERWFWRLAALLLAFLAVNKQLDLQSLLTAVARCHAQLNGWYDGRRDVQLAFILAMIAVSGLGLVFLLVQLRRLVPQLWPALLGLAFVSGFVLVRAAGFHHVDTLIGQRLLGLRMNWLLEMPGPILVLVVAMRRLAGLKRASPAANGT